MRSLALALAAPVAVPVFAAAQDITRSPEAVAALTREWQGERFPDGRPKVPDAILERMRNVNLEEAWAVLRGEDFLWQFEGVYTPGEIDQRWSDEMERDFSRWLEDHIDELPVPKEQIQELLKERTW